MPLYRAEITVAQRVMTVVHVLFAAALGYGYTFESAELAQQPAYAAASELLPLPYQGAGFLSIAIVLAVGLVVHRRVVHVAGLAWLGVWMVAWAVILLIVWHRGQASFLAPVWPTYVAAACWASMLSLLARER